jgi:TM2 domain-containing membrane protein YozV
MKSKTTAYLLWLFLGIFGAHKFYLNKVGVGVLYLLTGGLFGIGLLIDLFTLGGQVDTYNALFGRLASNGSNTNLNNNNNTIVVNVPGGSAEVDVSTKLSNLHDLKEKGVLSEEEYIDQKNKILSK